MAAKKPSRLDNLDHNLSLGIRIELQDLDLLEIYRFYNINGYPATQINRKTISLHRLVHSRKTGKPLSEYTRNDIVRHIEPDSFNACRSNLYEKTGAIANLNDLNVALSSDNTSGTNGVSWNKQNKRWEVNLGYRGRKIFLGLYDTPEEAARVAIHCRNLRAEITCADTEMDYGTMKALLQAASKTTKQEGSS